MLGVCLTFTDKQVVATKIRTKKQNTVTILSTKKTTQLTEQNLATGTDTKNNGNNQPVASEKETTNTVS